VALFDFLKRKKEEEPKGLVEFYHPARPPALNPDVFDVLRPPEETGMIQAPGAFEVIRKAEEPTGFGILETFPVREAPARVPPPAEPARRAPPVRRAAPPPPILRRPPELPSEEWLSGLFDLPSLWEMVREGRQDPEFRRAIEETERGGPQAELPLIMIAQREEGAEEEVARFLGIPVGDVERIKREGGDPWRELLNPVLYEIERALIWAMPEDLPGLTLFGLNDRDEFGLLYHEESPEV